MTNEKKEMDHYRFLVKYILLGLAIGFLIVLLLVVHYGLDVGMQILANYVLPIWFVGWLGLIIYSYYKLMKIKKQRYKL